MSHEIAFCNCTRESTEAIFWRDLVNGHIRTDEEVLCAWMHPRLVNEPDYPYGVWHVRGAPGQQQLHRTDWWLCRGDFGSYFWVPRPLDLDALREIESWLTDEQSREYDHLLYVSLVEQKARFLYTWHASATQKIKALATVVRGKA